MVSSSRPLTAEKLSRSEGLRLDWSGAGNAPVHVWISIWNVCSPAASPSQIHTRLPQSSSRTAVKWKRLRGRSLRWLCVSFPLQAGRFPWDHIRNLLLPPLFLTVAVALETKREGRRARVCMCVFATQVHRRSGSNLNKQSLECSHSSCRNTDLEYHSRGSCRLFHQLQNIFIAQFPLECMLAGYQISTSCDISAGAAGVSSHCHWRIPLIHSCFSLQCSHMNPIFTASPHSCNSVPSLPFKLDLIKALRSSSSMHNAHCELARTAPTSTQEDTEQTQYQHGTETPRRHRCSLDP